MWETITLPFPSIPLVAPAAELRTAALNSAFSLGMAASGPLRRLRQGRLDEIFSSGETLRLQFPKEDLGFVYHQQGAAVCKWVLKVLSV